MSAVALLDTNQQKISKKAAKQQAAKEKHQTNGTSAANGNNKEQQQSQPAILVLERSASSTSTPPPPSSSAMIAPTVRVKPVPAVAANQQRPSGRHQNPGATAAPPLPPTKRGAIAKPQPVPQSSVMDSTLELVLDTLPSAATAAVASVSSSAAIASNVGSAAPPERVEWVDLQRVDHGVAGRPMDVIVIGLSRGYQIWALLENGTCEEVVSERLGPLRIGLVLPSRVEPFQSDYRDTFADQRPLFALVDGTTRGANEREFCTAVMLSLKTGDIAHRLTFEEPVARIEASTKCLACSLTSRIVVVDAGTLTQRVSIFVEPGAFSTAAAALHDQWLAVGRQTLEARAQSCGGLGDDDRVASVASQMLSAFSSAVSHIGEHVVQLSRGGSPSGSTAAAMTETSASASLARQPVASLPSRGLVSVYDLNKVEQVPESRFVYASTPVSASFLHSRS